MKKIAYILLAAVLGFVACTDQPEVDSTISDAAQEARETLIVANGHYFGNINKADSSYAIALTLLSDGMGIVYDATVFSAYSGHGYVYDFIFNSSTEETLAPGTYVFDTEESYAPGTIHATESYLTILHHGNNTKVNLKDATVKVELSGEVYTITIAATTMAGVDVVSTYTGEIEFTDIFTHLEPTDTTHFNADVLAVGYEADGANREEWAVDSMYSAYAEMYAYNAELCTAELEGFLTKYGTYLEMYVADTTGVYDEGAKLYQIYADSLLNATSDADKAKYQDLMKQYELAALLVEIYLTYEELAYYAQAFASYAEQYAELKEAATPTDAHYITVVDADGNTLSLDIALSALSSEYHEVLPDGEYSVLPGYYNIKQTENYRSAGKITSSHLLAADGSVYYIAAGVVDVKFDGNQVASLKVKAYSWNGSKINYEYSAK